DSEFFRRQIGDALVRDLAHVLARAARDQVLGQIDDRYGYLGPDVPFVVLDDRAPRRGEYDAPAVAVAVLALEMRDVGVAPVHDGPPIVMLADLDPAIPLAVGLEFILIVPVLVLALRDDCPFIVINADGLPAGQGDGALLALCGRAHACLLWLVRAGPGPR